jgi:nitric oxide dioxygenase
MNPVPEFTFTPKQQRLVRDSFQSIQEYSDSVVLLFYGRLFELAPQTRSMFKIDIREQARKLMDMLTTVVDSLNRLEELRPQLAELGKRHVGYGVQPEHYEVLIAALSWAFGQALGVEFDRETRAAWRSLLEAIAKVMLDGAGALDDRSACKI